jgi:ketosteroid isomerase-like protein
VRYAALLLVLAGCGGRPSTNATPAVPFTVQVLEADSIAHALVQRAFDADVQLANPDSLYIPDAEIIVNGVPRADAPRFAGVAAGGVVQLGSSRFAVTGNYVWGTIQYRWVPGSVGKRMVDGWATFVLVRTKEGGWRIAHAHSSTAPE